MAIRSNNSKRRSPGLQERDYEPPNDFHELLDEALYESDEFRVYGYKLNPCRKIGCHSWGSCPFLHLGERPRRRDPRLFNYVAIPCPDYKYGGWCRRGDFCLFSHGVFEYWLHPAKYRTRWCKAGQNCTRRVCFFAHSQLELRPEVLYAWYYFRGPGQWQWHLQLQPYIELTMGGAFSTFSSIVAHLL